MKIKHPSDTQIPALRQLWQRVFGDTEEFLDLFFSVGYDRQRCLCACHGEQVAAAMYWLDCTCDGRRVAYLYAVATEEAFRGRGLCRALTEQAHRVLKERGYAGAILVPAEPGLFAMYGKMGYRTCTSVEEWEASAASDPLVLTELSKEEYAVRRRKMLPAGGVVQEGETLELLAGMGRFYAGADVLLMAISTDAGLWVPELLGDRTKSGAVVAALGATHGKFRGPGEDTAFAMYCAFDGMPAPNYLGFALD